MPDPQQRTAPTGLLIALEGPDGAGKTTQARLLADRLTRHGHQVTVTREPGGTLSGTAIRGLVLDPNVPLAPTAEMLLFAADRAQHLVEVIHPALNAGQVVVTDRFVGSSLVYQGIGRGLGVDVVTEASRLTGAFDLPTVTVVIDVPVPRDLITDDRFEGQGEAFFTQVRTGFLTLAELEGWPVVDGTGTPDRVADAVWAAVEPHLPTR